MERERSSWRGLYDESGHTVIRTNGGAPPGGSGAVPPSPPGRGGRPGFGPHPGERMPPLPFGLGTALHVAPLDVPIAGGRIRIFPDPAPLARTINLFWLAMLPIGTFVVLAAWLLGRYIAGEALRPLVETTASLHRFGQGDFTPRPVDKLARNEIGELVFAYNAAAAQVGAAFEERRLAEMQMRQFVADAGHELRTPLTVIMGFVDVLRRRRDEGHAGNARIYDTMLLESRRMRALIDKLIVLARLEHATDRLATDETVDLFELAERCATAHSARESAPPIVVNRDGRARVRGDEHELYDALSNLVENALKYAPGSPIELRAYDRDGSACVDVIDRGPGIAREEATRVFDRFYRGRDRDAETEGFGLGLAIAKRSVERAGGRLTLTSEFGAGCRFTIAIPLAAHGEPVAIAV